MAGLQQLLAAAVPALRSTAQQTAWQLTQTAAYAKAAKAAKATSSTLKKMGFKKKKVGDKGKKGGPPITDEKSPRVQQIIAMLQPPSGPPPPTPLQLAKAATAAKAQGLPPPQFDSNGETLAEAEAAHIKMLEYREKRLTQQHHWAHDMKVKHTLQVAALRALPPFLQVYAQSVDKTPWPPARKFYFDTPPDAYK